MTTPAIDPRDLRRFIGKPEPEPEPGNARTERVAAILLGDVAALAAAEWRKLTALERLEVSEVSTALAARLEMLANLAAVAGVDLAGVAVPALVDLRHNLEIGP